jgi:hypothetical protein
MFLRNVGLTFNGLHSVISQKMVLFKITAVRTSNPTVREYFTIDYNRLGRHLSQFIAHNHLIRRNATETFSLRN